jgi:hypothetical protein
MRKSLECVVEIVGVCVEIVECVVESSEDVAEVVDVYLMTITVTGVSITADVTWPSVNSCF